MILNARSVPQAVSLIVLSGFFFFVGASHFVSPDWFEAIVPPWLPKPGLLVIISGACEIVGAVGFLIFPLRQIARWGLILLLIAVFPANLHMALHAPQFANYGFPDWMLYVRLPLQALLIYWVWWTGQPPLPRRIAPLPSSESPPT